MQEPGGMPEEGNCRNGFSEKTLALEHGTMRIEAPRDRDGQCEPLIVRKGQRRFVGFDEKIIALYSRGMSVREIKAFLEEQYGAEVSADLISAVTSGVIEDMKAWQTRPLDKVYPVVFLDTLRVKIRDEGLVRNKAVYLALGVRVDGMREVPGLWIEQNEGKNFGGACAPNCATAASRTSSSPPDAD